MRGGGDEKCKRLKILKEKVRNFPWHPEEGYNNLQEIHTYQNSNRILPL
jgi:hypothetical protein